MTVLDVKKHEYPNNGKMYERRRFFMASIMGLLQWKLGTR